MTTIPFSAECLSSAIPMRVTFCDARIAAFPRHALVAILGMGSFSSQSDCATSFSANKMEPSTYLFARQMQFAIFLDVVSRHRSMIHGVLTSTHTQRNKHRQSQMFFCLLASPSLPDASMARRMQKNSSQTLSRDSHSQI